MLTRQMGRAKTGQGLIDESLHDILFVLFLLSLQKCVSGHVPADNARRYAQRERAVMLIKKKKKQLQNLSNITYIIKRWRVDNNVKIFTMKKLWLRVMIFFFRFIDGNKFFKLSTLQTHV